VTGEQLSEFVRGLARVTGFVYLSLFAVMGARIAAGGPDVVGDAAWWDTVLVLGAVLGSEWRWARAEKAS
jgi:hypothetical protein